jgi:hypothetical protein
MDKTSLKSNGSDVFFHSDADISLWMEKEWTEAPCNNTFFLLL